MKLKHTKKIFLLLIALAMISPLSLIKNTTQACYASDTPVSLTEARANTNPNLVLEGQVTDNIRDSSPNGMTFANNVYTMTSSGTYLRSTTLVEHPLLDKDHILLNSTKTESKILDAYYKGVFKWKEVKASRTCGIVIGKTVVDSGEKVYLSVVMLPSDNKLALYYYSTNPTEGDQNKMIDVTSVTFADGFNYTLEVVKYSKGVSIYINSKLIFNVESFQNDLDFSTRKTIENINLNNLIPAVGATFCDIDCTLKELTFKYLNSGTYNPFIEIDEDYEFAKSFDNENIFSKDIVKASGNKRDKNLNGYKFINNEATMEFTGSWLRAINVFTNAYLDSNTIVDLDGVEKPTTGMDAYYKATFSYSGKHNDRTLGIIVGKTIVMNQTVYLGVQVCPTGNYACLYFNTNQPYDFTKSFSCPMVLKENVEYVMEVVIRNGVLKMFIDGKKYLEVSEYDVTAYGSDDVVAHINIADLTPCFGTSMMDIDAKIKNFEYKLLKKYKEIKIHVEPDYPNYSSSYSYNIDIKTPNLPDSKVDFKIQYIVCYTVLAVSAIGVVIGIVLLISRRKKHEKK